MIVIQPIRQRVTCACMMIVRDAEGTIQACMDSILRAGCFNQIIVILDTRSKDATAQILARYARTPGVEIHLHRWRRNDFSVARNKALQYARSSYGFWMDADDLLVDAAGLRALLDYPQGKAYYFWCHSPLADGRLNITPHLRLFPIVPGVKWELPIHEQILFSLRRLKIPEVKTPYKILHLGYLFRDKVDRSHRRNYWIMKNWITLYGRMDEKTRYLGQRIRESQSYLKGAKRAS